MDGLTIFVGRQIEREIDWLAANFAMYFFGRGTPQNSSLESSQVA
jgi:hypothetical protein